MLRWLIRFIVLAALVGVGGAFLLPSTAAFKREATIAAPPAKIYALISNYKRFNEWSPWFDRDPAAKYSFSGADKGVGAKMAWDSAKSDVGKGTQEIVAAVQDKSMDVKMDFGEMGFSNANFLLEPAADGNSTKVTWGFSTDLGMNPVARWMGLVMDRMVGPDYEKGLAKLKVAAEKP